MKQYRYEVLHKTCGKSDIVQCWVGDLLQETCGEDEHIKKFAAEYHTYRAREDGQQPCQAAMMESDLSQYEIVKRRF